MGVPEAADVELMGSLAKTKSRAIAVSARSALNRFLPGDADKSPGSVMSFLDFVELRRLRFAIEGNDGFFIMRKAALRLRPLIEFQPGRETAERVAPFNIQIDAETLMIERLIFGSALYLSPASQPSPGALNICDIQSRRFPGCQAALRLLSGRVFAV